MGVTKDFDDIRITAAKLTDENKKYVIAVAQALLFTQKGGIGGQKKRQDMACLNQK